MPAGIFCSNYSTMSKNVPRHAQDRPGQAQDKPKTGQDRAETSHDRPREPQDSSPRQTQDRPRQAPRVDFRRNLKLFIKIDGIQAWECGFWTLRDKPLSKMDFKLRGAFWAILLYGWRNNLRNTHIKVEFDQQTYLKLFRGSRTLKIEICVKSSAVHKFEPKFYNLFFISWFWTTVNCMFRQTHWFDEVFLTCCCQG